MGPKHKKDYLCWLCGLTNIDPVVLQDQSPNDWQLNSGGYVFGSILSDSDLAMVCGQNVLRKLLDGPAALPYKLPKNCWWYDNDIVISVSRISKQWAMINIRLSNEDDVGKSSIINVKSTDFESFVYLSFISLRSNKEL